MKKNIKKNIVILGLAMLLSAGMMTACGSSGAEAPASKTEAAKDTVAAETKKQEESPKEESPKEEAAAAKTDERPKDWLALKDIAAGSVVVFGSYEQDGNEENGKEPIDWIVLGNDGKNLFLLSRYVLDAQPFNKESGAVWESSSLRTWLNTDFYENAFSPDEQSLIQTSAVPADPNPESKIEPGADTEDKVFLLSITEAETYLPRDRDRQCWSTAYASSQGVYCKAPYDLADSWILRSPGSSLDKEACLYYNGAVSYTGVKYRDECAVRPALRISGSELSVLKDASDERQTQLSQDESEALASLGKEPADDSGRAFDQAAVAGASAWATVTMGAWEQDDNEGNGKEAIEWTVLANDGEKALLVSKYGLDCKPYHSVPSDITWEKSFLRAWLNSDFLNVSFSAEERDRILTTDVPADKNPDYETDPGADTQDKIFLLSISEVQNYFGASKMSDDGRKCEATAYAKAQGAQTTKQMNCYWWLRNPSRGTAGKASSFAVYVSAGGEIETVGDYAESARTYTVRPAMWVSIAP